MAENISKLKQTIILENRERLHLSGIREVKSFNEQEVALLTDFGELHIKGEGMQVGMFNVETGDMSISGNVSALGYKGNSAQKGIIGRILK